MKEGDGVRERACSRLGGGGEQGLTKGWELVWEDSHWRASGGWAGVGSG